MPSLLRAGLDVEGRGLVGILAVAQALLGDQAEAEALGQVLGCLAHLPGHPGGDGGVVGGGALEGRQGAGPAILQAPGPGLQLLQEGVVLAGIREHGDRGVVLGGGADHAGAADIDLLDAVLEADAGLGDGGLEGIEVHHHQVDGRDAQALGVRHMVGLLPRGRAGRRGSWGAGSSRGHRSTPGRRCSRPLPGPPARLPAGPCRVPPVASSDQPRSCRPLARGTRPVLS